MIEATSGFPSSSASSVPAVTAAQMAELDRLAVVMELQARWQS
jgi:hypothetical protein